VREEVERFLRRLGYRLVLKELKHPRSARAGEVLQLSMKWQNAGSAPCYKPYRLAYRIANDDGYQKVIPSDVTVDGWLPGSVDAFTEEFIGDPKDLPPGKTVVVADDVVLPGSVQPGNYTLSIAVIGQDSTIPVVQLGISGRQDDGSYPVSRIEVKR
jgi:hypothetical protein